MITLAWNDIRRVIFSQRRSVHLTLEAGAAGLR